MPYADSPTIKEINDTVLATLATDGIDHAGRDVDVMLHAINAAAREVGQEVLRLNKPTLVYTKVYTVAAGDASIALPDGSEGSYPRWRRIIEVKRTDQGEPWPLEVRDPRVGSDEPAICARGSWVLVPEGLTLRFAATGGCPEACTITLRYLAALPQATRADMDTALFGGLPHEWVDALIDLATARLVPTKDSGVRDRYERRARHTLATLATTDNRPVHTGTAYIRRDP